MNSTETAKNATSSAVEDRPRRWRRVARIVGGLLAVLLLTVLLLGLAPASLDGLASQPAPAVDYAEATARFEEIQAIEEPKVTELTRSVLMAGDGPTARAYVLIHGATNSPHQFVELGELLHARGHNVLILRLPYHGLRSHTISELRRLTAADLRAYADEAVNIAAGLADEVSVIGLSGGGAVTTWIAQNRADVDEVLAISPFLGIVGTPAFLDWFAANLFARMPNVNFTSAAEDNRAWVYRGESSRGVAAFLLLARAAMQEAGRSGPEVEDIVVLTTAVDDNVDNRTIARLVEQWRSAGADVATHEFDAALDIPHDSIDSSTDPGKRRTVFVEILAALGERPLE